jgi:hypothetical protein
MIDCIVAKVSNGLYRSALFKRQQKVSSRTDKASQKYI